MSLTDVRDICNCLYDFHIQRLAHEYRSSHFPNGLSPKVAIETFDDQLYDQLSCHADPPDRKCLLAHIERNYAHANLKEAGR